MSKIEAKIIADSKNEFGNRITTMILTYPRIIHSEFMTHRMFSRNAASSRAVPAAKLIQAVKDNPFIPLAFQKQHSGMQGTEYITDPKEILYISPEPIITYIDTINVSSFPGVAYAITTCDKLHNESDVVYINLTVTPPTNDNCIAAQSLTPGISCSPITGTLSNSAASGIPKPSCDGFSSPTLLDVWYKFTATSVVHTIKVLPDGDFDPVLSLYTACSNSELDCADNGGPGISDSIVATNLNVGTTYYVRLYDYGSLPPATPTFGICVTEPFVASGLNNTLINSLNVYPNPSDGSVLYGNVNVELLSICIHDVLGRLVFEKQVTTQNGKFSISFPEKLKSGVYLFTATNADLRYTQRIVIE